MSLRLGGGARLALWPGFAGRNVVDLRLPGRTPTATVVGEPRRPAGDAHPRAGRLVRRPPAHAAPGAHGARHRRRRAHARRDRDAGHAERRAAGSGGARAATGPVAAGEAADLAVGAQRVGRTAVRVTLLSQDGAGVPDALVLVGGHVAIPCPGAHDVCYQAPIRGGRRERRRLGAPARPAAGDRPPADARRRRTARRRPSAPGCADVPGAAQPARRERARLGARPVGHDDVLRAGAGSARDRRPRRRARAHHRHQPLGSASRTAPGSAPRRARSTSPTRSGRRPPRPSTSPRRAGTTTQLTLVQPGGPTFFRLWIDRRTGVVVRLRMITTAHFMSERELDLNHAPPVVPPA